MNFEIENSQDNLILDSENNSLDSSVETEGYGLNPIADEFSRKPQLGSITVENLGLESV